MSLQLTLTEPSAGSTASHWLNWSFTTAGESSFVRAGCDHVAPPSVERETRTSVPPARLPSVNEQASVASDTAPHAGYISAPRLCSAGMSTSNGIFVVATVCTGPKARPPSVELDSAIRLLSASFHATCSVPFGVTYGSAPITPCGPLGLPLATTGAEKVTPPSVDRETRTWLWAFELPLLLSHAT